MQALRQVQCRRHAGVRVLSESAPHECVRGWVSQRVERGVASSRITEVTVTAVPAGTSPVQQSPLADLDRCGLGRGFPRSPLEARAVGSKCNGG
jgi:hypothetical protein